mmetsp:Transcript_12018/g.21330  ORF Transcript_12018/g.21330 Transcript_12018/m.21330 type:complete len:258 (-) Transcript_12018:1156-1929(-)
MSQSSRPTDFSKTSAPPSLSHSAGALPPAMIHEKTRVASSRTSPCHESISGSATSVRNSRSSVELRNLERVSAAKARLAMAPRQCGTGSTPAPPRVGSSSRPSAFFATSRAKAIGAPVSQKAVRAVLESWLRLRITPAARSTTSLFQCPSSSTNVLACSFVTSSLCVGWWQYAAFQHRRSASHVAGASFSAASIVRHCSRRALSSVSGRRAHTAFWSSRQQSPSLRRAACRWRTRPARPMCWRHMSQSIVFALTIRS